MAHYPLRIRSVRGYCCFVVEKFSTSTHHKILIMNNTILAILQTLNILAFVTEMTVKSTVRVIALAIVLGEYTWTGVQVIYNNRRDIVATVNNIRNDVGNKFVYASWEGGTGVVDLPLFSCIVSTVQKFPECLTLCLTRSMTCQVRSLMSSNTRKNGRRMTGLT